MKKENEPKKQKKDNPLSPKDPKDWRNLVLYFVIGLISISILVNLFGDTNTNFTKSFSQFSNELSAGQIKEVTLRPQDNLIIGKTSGGEQFKTYYVNHSGFIDELREKNVEIKVSPGESGWVWSVLLQALLPFLLIGFLWFFIFRQAQGANNQALSFGKSRATPWQKDKKDRLVTFKDVAGVDEAIEELKEIVDYLKSPDKYKKLGAKIPKGALLMGPPGTGKTLLAKAVAGEADVPFFSLSGSDFVEMFVGVGASRVRDLFKQATKAAPSIIFVDEIDAVGRHRGAGLGGGHDEREQTLNQLLVEMDGFDPKSTVIVFAATNRPDILDPALLRPGRFDRQITVDQPDVSGRHAILKIHARNKKFDKDVDLEVIAKRTSGFTGADLANLLNEATLLTARKNLKKVTTDAIEESIDRVIAGPQRKSRVMSEKERQIIAFHEVGHALVAKKLPDTDPVHKVTILPRGQALGYTLQLPEKDTFLKSKSEIEHEIQILLGGRIAEELQFDSVTSGASNDFQKVTALAKGYVCKYGMSDTLGPRAYGRGNEPVFVGRSYNDHSQDYSDKTARDIDEEINKLVDTCYKHAKKILTDNKDALINISNVLLERETLDGEEFGLLMDGKELPPVLEKKADKPSKKDDPKASAEEPANSEGNEDGSSTQAESESSTDKET